jgi:glycosyltransferase involved in cell wall biosynthesis
MARIAHVSESLATGVLSVLSILTHGQAKDGHEVILFASQQREDTPAGWREALPERLRFVEIPMRREIDPKADLRGLFELWRALRACRPDVVHLHSSKAGALGRVAALPLRARVVYQPHGLAYLRSDVSSSSRLAYRWIEGLLALLGGTVVACSEGERAALHSVVPPSRSVVVVNGVELSSVVRADPCKERVRIGTCGRISPQKRPEFFAEVSRALRSDADFVWIGDGEPESKEALLGAGVEVTGWCSRAEAQRRIAALQIYVQTSAWEGMPISMIEAMAAGLPAVATDIIGNRDLLLGTEAGVLVDTPAEMIGALSTFIRSAERRRIAGGRARELVERKYSSTKMVENFYGVYGIDERARSGCLRPHGGENPLAGTLRLRRGA